MAAAATTTEGRDSRESRESREGALSPVPRVLPADLRLMRASSETWTDNLSRRSGPFRKISSSRERDGSSLVSAGNNTESNSSADDTNVVGTSSSSSGMEQHRKIKPVLANLNIDEDGAGSSYTSDEVELSSALSELTFAVAQENLNGIAMRHPPEVVRDRLHRVARSLLSTGPITLDSAVDSNDTMMLVRFAVATDLPPRPSSATGIHGKSYSNSSPDGAAPRAASYESRHALRNSLDNSMSPILDDLSDTTGLPIPDDDKIVFIDENTSSQGALPLVLDKFGLEAPSSEYCLVAIDTDGTERLLGDDEQPLTLQQQLTDVIFRLRRRKSLELQNERLFKQIMEEEGQLASLEYFTRSESNISIGGTQGDEHAANLSSLDAQTPLSAVNFSTTAAAEAATLRYYEKYQPTADVATQRNVQWELIGMPMNTLLLNTLSQLEQHLTLWQERSKTISTKSGKDDIRELVDSVMTKISELHQNSSGAYNELMDTIDKEIPLILPVKGYRVETCVFSSTSAYAAALSLGKQTEASSSNTNTPSRLDGDPDLLPVLVDPSEPIFHYANNDPVYRAYFYDSRHLGGQLNFVGCDPKIGPMCVSVARETDSEGTPRLRVLLWTRDGSHVRFLPMSIHAPVRGEALADLLSAKLSNINGGSTPVTPLPLKEQIFTWVPDEDFSKALLKLEGDQLESGYKIGVLYVKNGQMREDEMFGNPEGSATFDEFLNVLGERVVLNGWAHFKAGLDTSGGNSNGVHSVYTNWRNVEIMYHVSTLLPHDAADPQQLGRKRHIGNDICVILFLDGPTSYLPDTVASRFNHVFAVVRPNADNTYSLAMAVKDTIPPFGPEIDRKRYPRDKSFRDLLLAKLLNGQNAAYRAPVFREKLRRTREFLLNDIIEKYKNHPSGTGKSATLSQKSGKTAAITLSGEKEKGRFPKMMKSFTVRKFSSTFGSSTQSSGTTTAGSLAASSSTSAGTWVPPATAPPLTNDESPASKPNSTESVTVHKPRFSASFVSFGARRSTLDVATAAKLKKQKEGEATSDKAVPEEVAVPAPDSAKLPSKLQARNDYVA